MNPSSTHRAFRPFVHAAGLGAVLCACALVAAPASAGEKAAAQAPAGPADPYDLPDVPELQSLAELRLATPLDGEPAPGTSGKPIADLVRSAHDAERFDVTGNACFRLPPVPDVDAPSLRHGDLRPSVFGATAVRVQRIVVDEAGPRIEVVDGFVDPKTRKTMTVRSASAALRPVADAAGVTAYAYREGTVVMVVAVEPTKPTPGVCRQVRVALDGQRRGGDDGRVTVQLAKDARVFLAASVSKLRGKPRVSASFVGGV